MAAGMTLLHLVFALSGVLILALGAIVLLAQKIDSARFCGSCRRMVSGAENERGCSRKGGIAPQGEAIHEAPGSDRTQG